MSINVRATPDTPATRSAMALAVMGAFFVIALAAATFAAQWFGTSSSPVALLTLLATAVVVLVLGRMIWTHANTIDHRGDALAQAQRELRDLNETLEARVRARTRELERANDDVTAEVFARRRAEEELRRTSDELRGLFEASPLAICGLTPDDLVFSWNPAAEQFFGWTADEVIGKRLPIVSDLLRAEAHALTVQAVSGTPVVNFETQRLDKHGNTIDVSISTAALHDASGAARGIVAVYADMRDRKSLESQLRQAQKMEAVGRLAGGVAHDFNNILTVIQGAAEFLLTDLDENDRRRADAVEIGNAAQRAAKLTRQLLAFSRQQVLELQVLDFNMVVEPLEPMLRRLLEANIGLSLRLSPNLDLVKADPNQLDQVLINLVVNARDAMPDGGTILIETSNVVIDEEYPRQHLNARSGPHVMLSVMDTGGGMDAETQSRIFEPFFTTKATGKGTGLGLATVYGIVKQLGGHVWVYSELGRGTTFKVYLPVEVGVAAVAAPTPKFDRTRITRGARILLVEDDPSVRATVKMLLERQEYVVSDVASGDEALEQVRRLPDAADLVLSDIMMAGITGIELRSRLRDMGATSPVLLMSGYSEGGMRHLDDTDDLTPHIEKPFTADRLVSKIEELLRGV